MIKRAAALLLLIGVCFVQPSTSLADTIPRLPLATVYQSVTLPTGAGNGGFGYTFGSYQVTYPGDFTAGAMSAATSAYGGTDPVVTASASFSSTPGAYNGMIEADSYLVYHFEVVGPSGTPVPVQLVASGQATSTDSTLPLYAELTIAGNGSTFDVAACGNPAIFVFCNKGPNPQQFNVDTILYFTPNTDYEVTMEANIEAGLFDGPLPSGAFSASAYVDPTLQIDPGFSGQYSLVTSSNLAATPEPSSLLLTATGAFALATFGYKAKPHSGRRLRPYSN